MAKNRCGHKGRIEKLSRTGSIKCHKYGGREVPIEAGKDGNNYCRYDDCPHKNKPIPRVEV